jgi:hypothetical protein
MTIFIFTDWSKKKKMWCERATYLLQLGLEQRFLSLQYIYIYIYKKERVKLIKLIKILLIE